MKNVCLKPSSVIVIGSSLSHRVYRRLELERLSFQIGSLGIADEMMSSWNTDSSRPIEYIFKCR